MTLEDFFTLTEMKEGLTVPSRVRELVTVMQKEKDCVVKNIGDASRQWAAVASTIAATEREDCLDLFIQLGGLWFIDKWLKDAQRFSNDTNDGSVEESITALLRALGKLRIGKEKSISSGIWITVNNLLHHSCTQIRDRARALFDGWKEGMSSDTISGNIWDAGESHDGLHSCESSRTEFSVDLHPAKGRSDGDNNVPEPTSVDTLQSRSSNSLQPETAVEVRAQPHINEIISKTILDDKNADDRSLGPIITSVVSISTQESASLKEATVSSSERNSSTEIQNFSVPKQQIAEPEPDSQKQPRSFQGKSGLTASAFSNVETGAISASGNATSAQEDAEPMPLNNADAKEDDFSLNPSAFCDGEMPTSAPKVGVDDVEATNHFNMLPSKAITNDGVCDHDAALLDQSGTESRLEKSNKLQSLSQMEEAGTAGDVRDDSDNDRGLCSDEDEDLRDGSDFSKPTIDTRSPNLIDRRSDIELEYGIVDALEVARQVAQEVEREVVDYREPSCSSSSEKIVGGDVRQPSSPDSVGKKLEQTSGSLPDEMTVTQNQPTKTATEGERCLVNNSDNLDTEAENGMRELESSQVTEVAKEEEVKAEKALCDFDLNQEVGVDDMGHPVNSTLIPISVVSASRPAAASGLRAAPFQFEGTLGWKGSAATSAFRPASPRRTSDSDKTLETGCSSNTRKQRQDSLDIDLNVAGCGDERVPCSASERQNPVSSDPKSGESSWELGSRKSDMPNLDLNRISDDDALPSDSRMEGHLYSRNGHCSPSPASSSSSMQHSMRNFDLNDRPLLGNEFPGQGLNHSKSSQNPSPLGGSRPADPVISIMGKRVEVGNRVDVGSKDWIPQMLSLQNGKPPECAVDANVVRMGNGFGVVPSASYMHTPLFGYNGVTSISSAMYGPGSSIPCMADTRGAHFVPQIMGPASAVLPCSQPPFVVSMTGAPLGLGVAGSSRPNLDLNSGFAIDGGNTRQFFMPGQGRSLEANPRPSSSSGVGGKRKEPDVGWDPHSLQNKHRQGPWR